MVHNVYLKQLVIL